jgi:hypothetical protein
MARMNMTADPCRKPRLIPIGTSITDFLALSVLVRINSYFSFTRIFPSQALRGQSTPKSIFSTLKKEETMLNFLSKRAFISQSDCAAFRNLLLFFSS